jgi:hypothetical protein
MDFYQELVENAREAWREDRKQVFKELARLLLASACFMAAVIMAYLIE